MKICTLKIRLVVGIKLLLQAWKICTLKIRRVPPPEPYRGLKEETDLSPSALEKNEIGFMVDGRSVSTFFN